MITADSLLRYQRRPMPFDMPATRRTHARLRGRVGVNVSMWKRPIEYGSSAGGRTRPAPTYGRWPHLPILVDRL